MINALITVSTFLTMEGITWLTHRFVMHGFLWNLHEDHHNKNSHSFFEKNDYFFVIFAIPSMILIITGSLITAFGYLFYIGIGVSAYGLAYFLVHEIFIHQRFKIFTHSNNIYLRALRKAHKIHHKHLGKEEGE